MEYLLFWGAIGAFIGYKAAEKKGFSVPVGCIAGAALGPIFAFALFYMSGVGAAGDVARRKCPFCAEQVKPEATVCKHCHKDLPAAAPPRPAPKG